MFEKSIGGIVFRKEKNKIYYLLLHYETGHWGFPKGHVEKEETEIETLIREIKEETGISDLKIIEGFKDYVKYFFRPNFKSISKKKETKKKTNKKSKNKDLIFKIVIFYLVQTKRKKVKLSFEHIGYKWLSYQEALKRLTFKNTKEILKKANKFLKTKY